MQLLTRVREPLLRAPIHYVLYYYYYYCVYSSPIDDCLFTKIRALRELRYIKKRLSTSSSTITTACTESHRRLLFELIIPVLYSMNRTEYGSLGNDLILTTALPCSNTWFASNYVTNS
jgi:hypothetical protein